MSNTDPNFKKEEWRNYEFNFKIGYFFRLEFSSFGRVRSFNRQAPNGRILKGSLQQGFPIIKCNFQNPIDPKDQLKLDAINLKIDALSILIAALQTQVKAYDNDAGYLEKINFRTAERQNLINKRKKSNIKYKQNAADHFAILVHRGVAELFLKRPSEEEKFIIHKDYNKLNNQVDNLQWASQEKVTEHQVNSPIQIKKKLEEKLYGNYSGSRPNSKLSVNQVILIKRKLKKKGVTLINLAKQFGVSDMQIHRIKSGENWSSVKEVSEIQKSKKN